MSALAPRVIALLSRDPELGNDVSALCAGERYDCVVAKDLADLDTTGTCALVVDTDHPEASLALVGSPELLTIACSRTASLAATRGPRAVVARSALRATLRSITRASRQHTIELERLLSLAVGNGPVEHALAAAADEIAAAFDAERCVISVRGDSTGAASGTQTWSSLAWSETADRCRVASATDATLVGPAATDPDQCESVMAVPLDSGGTGRGFLGVIARGPRIFTCDERRAIAALGVRLSLDLDQRLAHERALEELDRVANAPGIDSLLGIWNRAALAQLAAMHVSSSERFARPLTALIVDVVKLQAINNQHGVDIGDRILRRIADSLRAAVRTEDVIGRWNGDKIALLLQGMGLDGARRLAERILSALDARHVELRKGETLPIRVKLGMSMLEPNEDASRFVERAATAAKAAPEHGVAMASAPGNTTKSLLALPLEVGEELRGLLGGTYRLVHEISRGGMGVVYRAEDLALERAVAIKMLRPDLAEDHAFIEQLRREAALLARVQHPNLVQVYSFGQVGGDSYFVMELVEGESLRHALDRFRAERESMPIGELLAVVNEIASALDTLHELGIIHRDVKPDNVIRDPFRGRSVLVDVGIARRFGQTTTSAGTPGYVAPEVIRGDEATARSDVYGLAALTYALLTLHEPWGEGAATDVLTRQLTGQGLVPLATLRPELAAVDRVLLQALALDPRRRPSSALHFARDLRGALPTSVVPPPRPAPITMILPRRAGAARTRGVVFRSLPRAFGAREAGRLRDTIGAAQPELARVIGDAAPLAWLPTDLLVDLLAVAPTHLGRSATALAQDIARASVRATFRRFFPASAATLAPERTLSAVRNIWSRYQSWGELTTMAVQPGEHVIRIGATLKLPELCAWAHGMIEQLVVLSGGSSVAIAHESCEARGDHACDYRVSWQRA
jgi:diguanylate cyclase (GGDEF)-like protein